MRPGDDGTSAPGPTEQCGMPRHAFFLRLLLLASLALAGRAVYILAETQHQELPRPMEEIAGTRRSFDEFYYERQANQIADGVWFKEAGLLARPEDETAAHPPLAALLLAPVAWVTGGSVLAMRFAMAVIGTLVVVLAGLIGREVTDARTGLLAAGLATVYPNLWMNDGLVLSESLAALCTAAVILLAYRLIRSPSWPLAVALGVAAGAGMLSRSELVLLLPMLVIPVALSVRSWSLRSSPARLVLAVVAVASAVVVVSPWVAYNLSRFEQPVLLSHGDGGVLIGANCDDTYDGDLLGFWNGFCGAELARADADRSVEAVEKRSAALDYVADHLDRVPVVVAARLGRIWSIYRPFQMNEIAQAEGRPVWASNAGLVMFWALVPLSVIGVVVLRRRGTPIVPLVGPVLAACVAGAAFYGLLRFRTVAEVSFVVLAAVALGAGRRWPNGVHQQRATRP